MVVVKERTSRRANRILVVGVIRGHAQKIRPEVVRERADLHASAGRSFKSGGRRAWRSWNNIERSAIPHHRGRSHQHHGREPRTVARLLARMSGLRVLASARHTGDLAGKVTGVPRGGAHARGAESARAQIEFSILTRPPIGTAPSSDPAMSARSMSPSRSMISTPSLERIAASGWKAARVVPRTLDQRAQRREARRLRARSRRRHDRIRAAATGSDAGTFQRNLAAATRQFRRRRTMPFRPHGDDQLGPLTSHPDQSRSCSATQQQHPDTAHH